MLEIFMVSFSNNNRVNCVINTVIALIDERLNKQLNLILHHSRFQQLEAAWRGIFYITQQISEQDKSKVKIKILNISWSELTKDLMRSAEFDQSQLFTKIYTNEFGQPGGEPYGVLIGDYNISHRIADNGRRNDIAVLRILAGVAAAAFAPFIVAADPSLFGLDNFKGLERSLSFSTTFQQTEYNAWKALRNDEDSRFISLVLPRTLMRLPYQNESSSKHYFHFEEITATINDYLWGNAVYCFAAVVTRSFLQNGWLANIQGVEKDSQSGGLVTDLVRHHFTTDIFGIAPKYSAEVCITDKQEKVLSDWGFIALCECKHTQANAFYSCPTIQIPKLYTSDNANQNARISSMLPYILCASRFAHYVKTITRDKLGSFANAMEYESYLQNWLRQYTAASHDLTSELKARYPLRDAKVTVREQLGKPGAYNCQLHLSPQYQLDQIQSQLALNTEFI